VNGKKVTELRRLLEKVLIEYEDEEDITIVEIARALDQVRRSAVVRTRD
jgi:hypothetical protein